MKKVLVNIVFRLANTATIAVCMLYLITLTVPYIDTGKFWMISILALGFPLLLGAMVIATVFWLLIRSWKAWACLVVILLGFQQIRAAFAFNVPGKFVMEKAEQDLRVMQWNVHNWNQIRFAGERDFNMESQPDMMRLIRKYNPDILCLEEFFENTNRKKFASNIGILQSMGYEHFYFQNDGLHDNEYYAGIAIFSKYPLSEGKSIEVDKGLNIEPIASVDVDIEGQTVRLMAVHLESVRFGYKDYQSLSNIKKSGGTDVSGGRTVLSKLKWGFVNRKYQAEAINREVENSPYPVIACGDFNDVPNSGTYFTVTKNLQDAFLKKGTFIGRTFRFISPTLRIDYVLPSRHFEVQQYKVVHAKYSDHYPVVTDLKLR
ncbi:MAG: endonuclease/exonuclease/phosphatase family protein [Chitinophagaceae bacterium]|nr:endonuclease/exonuclease/phosphatase family protein [Chitinophagaceae bacterium]